jgi:hypothetical protein
MTPPSDPSVVLPVDILQRFDFPFEGSPLQMRHRDFPSST